MREPLKPRDGREHELNIYKDERFYIRNLPTKARVLPNSNVPQVREELHHQLAQISLSQAMCQLDLLYNLFSFYLNVESQDSDEETGPWWSYLQLLLPTLLDTSWLIEVS